MIEVNEIPLREQPSHGAVKRVKRIEEDWFLIKLGWSGIKRLSETNSGMTIRDLKLSMFDEDPELMVEFMTLQSGLGEYQTIMLATGWSIKQMLEFEEEALEQEYRSLLTNCIETLGGTAADFFGTSDTGSFSRVSPTEEEVGTIPMTEKSKSSLEEQSTPSPKSGGPSGQPRKEKHSRSPKNSTMS